MRTEAGGHRLGARLSYRLLVGEHADRRRVRQVLGAIAQFGKASTVAKLAAARSGDGQV